MEEVLYEFPAYTQEIIENLIKNDWLIHSFELDNEYDIYNPAGYLYNSEHHGLEYTIHLDTNIYQYVLSAFKKNNKQQLHRDAIALLLFGRFINAVFDPTFAVYEKLNYSEQCPDELVDDLLLFRRIDNSDIDNLAAFALGYIDNIQPSELPHTDKDMLKFGLTKYRKLKKWDTFYLFVLKVTELYYFDKSSNEEKINTFIKWCFSDFLNSLVVISFVIKLMGDRASAKLMKYKTDLSLEKKKNELINMTWDLFLLDKFFENWTKKEQNKEFIYASNDKPLKEVLEIAISIQIKGNGDHLGDHLPLSLIEMINKIDDTMKIENGRRIVDTTDFKSHRDELIKQHELVILS